MPRRTSRPENLKEACIDEAFAVIETSGVEHLSLRAVARRLGVSHQAPYKHFPTRDHILAAVVARCYAEFALCLEARPHCDDAFEDLEGMGHAYLAYAMANPLKYRLMFNTPLPDPSRHPEMMANAQYAFSLLQNRLSGMTLRDPHQPVADPAKHDAIFIWATLHGLASIGHSNVAETIALDDGQLKVAMARSMARLSMALEPE